jgi:hypothetical protein
MNGRRSAVAMSVLLQWFVLIRLWRGGDEAAVPQRADVADSLLSGCLAVLLHDVTRDPAAVLDLDALLPGPFTDLVRVNGTGSAAAAGGPPGAAGLAAVRNVGRQGLVQFFTVRDAQIDLVVGAVETEAGSAFGLAAVDIVDEERLYLLGQRNCSIRIA